MLKGALLLASFGLGLNLFLWGIPGVVAASGTVHAVFPNATPTQLQTLNAAASGSEKSLYTALLKLIGVESEALQVAGDGLRQPTPADLAPRANAAGAHVEDAAVNYIRAAQALFSR